MPIPTTDNIGRMRAFESSSSASSSRCFDLISLHRHSSDISTASVSAHNLQPALCSSSSSSSSVDDQCNGPFPVFVAAQDSLLAGVAGGQPPADLEKQGFEGGVDIEAHAHSAVKKGMTPSLHRVSSMKERMHEEEEVEEDESDSVEKKKTKKKGSGGAFGFVPARSTSFREEHDHLLPQVSAKRQKEKVKVKRVHKHMEGPPLEAAVRRALSINQKPSCCSRGPSKLHVNKEATFLPKSCSAREYNHHYQQQKRSLHLPPTIILKRTISSSSKSMSLLESTDGPACHSDRHENRYTAAASKAFVKGSRSPPRASSVEGQEGVASYKGVGKSPSEKRWEEAAEDEERKERERRQRRSTLQSHSMRYDRSHRSGFGEEEEEEEEEGGESEEEWAVYKRSGFISVRPKEVREDMEGEWRSLRGAGRGSSRAWSMREGSSAPGWAAACGCGARLRCPCCCSVAAAAAPPPPPAPKKPRSGGFLGACRRLLGLAKKRPSPSSPSPQFDIS